MSHCSVKLRRNYLGIIKARISFVLNLTPPLCWLLYETNDKWKGPYFSSCSFVTMETDFFFLFSSTCLVCLARAWVRLWSSAATVMLCGTQLISLASPEPDTDSVHWCSWLTLFTFSPVPFLFFWYFLQLFTSFSRTPLLSILHLLVLFLRIPPFLLFDNLLLSPMWFCILRQCQD